MIKVSKEHLPTKAKAFEEVDLKRGVEFRRMVKESTGMKEI